MPAIQYIVQCIVQLVVWPVLAGIVTLVALPPLLWLSVPVFLIWGLGGADQCLGTVVDSCNCLGKMVTGDGLHSPNPHMALDVSG